MPEVYASNEVTVELIDPVTGEALSTTILYRRDLTISERPVYAQRGYHRSKTLSAAPLRSLGTVTFRKDSEGIAGSIAEEVKRWQKGVSFYALSSDLKGKRYRHPHLRMTFTNADGTTDIVTAYSVKLSDRNLSAPDGGIVGDSITLDVLGGIDGPNSDKSEPIRGLSLHRTGTATYLSTAGTLTTATDSQARIGLPWVVRRNLLASSQDFQASGWTKTRCSIKAGQAKAPDGTYTASKLVEDTSSGTHPLTQTASVGGSTFAATSYLKAGERTWALLMVTSGASNYFAYINLSTGALGNTGGSPTVTVTDAGEGFWKVVMTASGIPSASVTYEIRPATANGTTGYQGDGSSGIYLWGQQIESTATPYQPTHATGVDLTHPLNGAGLVFEGQSVNLLTANQSNVESGTTGFAGASAYLNGKSGIARSSTQAHEGAYSLAVTTPGSTKLEGAVLTGLTGRAASTAHSFSGMAYIPSGVTLSVLLRDHTNGVTGTAVTLYGNGAWQFFQCQVTTGAGAAEIIPIVRTAATAATTFYLDRMKLEASPFATSWHEGGTTRNADLVGIVPPHNELKYSHDLTQGAAGSGIWTRSAAMSITKSGSDNTLTLSATSGQVIQAVTPRDVAGSTWTVAAKVKAGTLSGSVRLRLLPERGSATATTTINTTDLSASEARTFVVTGTLPTTATGLRVEIIGSSGTGTVIVESIRLVRGSHPGPEVITTDTAIPAPVSPALDPAWQQNGAIEFDLLPPPISTGLSYLMFGQNGSSSYSLSPLAVARSSSQSTSGYQVIMERKHNGSTGTSGTAGRGALLNSSVNIWDGAKHTIRVEWLNYTISGVRVMAQRLYIDGTLTDSQDVAALYGATEWAEIDASKAVADGNVFSTLSDVRPYYPELPAGAIPAEG